MLAQRSVDLKPNDHRMLVGLAAVLYRAGRFAEALEQLTAANDVHVPPPASPPPPGLALPSQPPQGIAHR